MIYKAIIFDLGGVLINLNQDLTKQAFMELGVKQFDALYSPTKQNDLFDNYETGRISSADFIAELHKVMPSNVTDAQIVNAWNAMLLDIPEERLALLKRLKKRTQVFLLSNTNAIHLESITNYLLETYGIKELDSYFTKAYYSFKIGLRKPSKEIFEYVLNENHLKPATTLFIDDSKQHIETAEKLGIATHWLQPPHTVLQLFDSL